MKKIEFSVPEQDKRVIKDYKKILNSKWILNGPYVKKFEEYFENKLGFKNAAAVSSFTTGLHAVLQTLNIVENDEIILPAFNFIGSAIGVLNTKAKIIFVDTDDRTAMLNLIDLKKKITRKTRAIIILHYAGYVESINSIKDIVGNKKIFLIEDCAHSLGSRYEKNLVGSICDIGIFSFGPSKLITTSGMGGMVVSKNKKIVEKVKIFRSYGMNKNSLQRQNNSKSWIYSINEIGHNFRMTEYQAVAGLRLIPQLSKFIKKRKKLEKLYISKLSKVPIRFITKVNKTSNVPLYFPIILKNQKIRDNLILHLKNYNIATSVHWDPILSNHKLFRKTDNLKLNKAYNLSKTIISLPMHTKLSNKDINYISSVIINFFNK